jgi:hypothetical protein
MNKLLPPTIALIAGCVINCGIVQGTTAAGVQPCSAALKKEEDAPGKLSYPYPGFFLPDGQGTPDEGEAMLSRGTNVTVSKKEWGSTANALTL